MPQGNAHVVKLVDTPAWGAGVRLGRAGSNPVVSTTKKADERNVYQPFYIYGFYKV